MSLIETAASSLQALELEATKVEGFPVLNLTVKIPNGKLDIFIHAHEDTQRLLTYARPQGLVIRHPDIPNIADFINRANYGLPLGNFELDMNDGEINFKNSIDVAGGVLTNQMVETLVKFSIECVNHYLPGLKAVLEGQPSKQAIEAIDGPSKIRIV